MSLSNINKILWYFLIIYAMLCSIEVSSSFSTNNTITNSTIDSYLQESACTNDECFKKSIIYNSCCVFECCTVFYYYSIDP